MYQMIVYCPDDEKVIDSIMNAASNAGAGIVGNYSGCGFYSKGTGNWKSEEGSNPTIGKVGVYSHEPEVKIEMMCPDDCAMAVKKAIKEVHPYEEPVISFWELANVE